MSEDAYTRRLLTLESEIIGQFFDYTGYIRSPHEGWALLQGQMDNLWSIIRAGDGTTAAARRDAIQLAALAMRYVLELTDSDR